MASGKVASASHRIERRFEAPRQKVFEAWTRPEALKGMAALAAAGLVLVALLCACAPPGGIETAPASPATQAPASEAAPGAGQAEATPPPIEVGGQSALPDSAEASTGRSASSCKSGDDLPYEIEDDRACTLVYAAGLPLELNNPNLRGNGWNEATAILYSRLWHVGLDGKIQPDLVERHEIRDAGLTWRVHLRKGVVWHDGRPLDTGDVRATLEEIFDPGVASELDLNLPMVREIAYRGKRTLDIHLRYPYPLLPVPFSEIAILPAGPARTTITPPVGTGPYKFLRRREDGSIEVGRHRRFHLGEPSIPRIILAEVQSDARRSRDVAGGEVDLGNIKPQHASAIEGRSNTRVVRMSTGAWRGLPLNLRRPHLQDVRVRRAIDLAIDRKQVVVNALPRGGRPAFQPVPPASWAFSEKLDEPYYDPERAIELLEESGWFIGEDGLRWKGGHPATQVARASQAPMPGRHARQAESRAHEPASISPAARSSRHSSMGGGIDLPEGETPEGNDGPLTLRLIVWKDEAFRLRASQIIRIHLHRVGIKVELELVDNATYSRLADDMGLDYDGFVGGWGSLLDPGDNLYKKFHSRGSQNYMGYSNETVDRMLDECRAAADPEAAKDLYVRLMEFLRGEAVLLPHANPDYLFGARTRVGGIEPAIVDSWYEFTRNAWRWRLEAE